MQYQTFTIASLAEGNTPNLSESGGVNQHTESQGIFLLPSLFPRSGRSAHVASPLTRLLTKALFQLETPELPYCLLMPFFPCVFLKS